MMYIYAGLLLLVAKREINEDNLRKILLAAGITVDEERLKAAVNLFKSMDEKTLKGMEDEIVKEKQTKKEVKEEQQQIPVVATEQSQEQQEEEGEEVEIVEDEDSV